MLVLTRRPNESITIAGPSGAPVVVTLLEVRGQQVRLGITADPSVVVSRVLPTPDVPSHSGVST